MAVIKITYNELSAAKKNSIDAAKKLESYASNLNKQIASKLSDINNSNNINSALSSTQSKIKELNKKAEAMRNFSSDIDTISTKVKDTDKQVAKSINSSLDELTTKNSSKVSQVMSDIFQWLTVDVMNKTTFGRWVKDAFNKVKDIFSDLATNIRHWYRTGGGKYIVDSLLAIVGAGVAIISCAGASGVILAILAAVAAFAVVNAAANIIGNTVAYVTNYNGDPAWANRYDKNNKFTDWIRFLNKNDNKFWNGVASLLDITESAVTVISAVYGIGKALNSISNIFKNKGFNSVKALFGTNYKKVDGQAKNSVGIIGSKFMTYNKKGQKTFTIKSIGNGLKSLITDDKFRADIGNNIKLFGDEVVDAITYKKVQIKQCGHVWNDFKSGDASKMSRAVEIFKLNIKDGFKSLSETGKELWKNAKIDTSSINKLKDNEVNFGITTKAIVYIDQFKKMVDKIKNPEKIYAKNLSLIDSNIKKIGKVFNVNIDLKSIIKFTVRSCIGFNPIINPIVKVE